MLGRLAAIFLLCTLAFFTVRAQTDCETALLIPFPATDTSPFSLPSVATFSAPCVGIPNPVPEDIDGGSPCTIGICSQEVWFYTDPNELVQQNLWFELTTNFNGRIKWVLLYSESVDGSIDAFPHCRWNNGNTTNLSQRGSGCADATTGTPINFLPEGLDGSGYYFLLIQRETGTGGNIAVRMRKQTPNPTVSAPANDLCSNAINLQTPAGGGLGIDNQYASGGSGTWVDAIIGTTKGATKLRQSVAEGGDGRNEDTYEYTSPFTGVFSNNTIGDVANILGVTEGCLPDMDNSVYYTFSPPVDGANWFLHLGDLSCSWGPDTLEVLIADILDCTDASLTTLLPAPWGCNKANVTGLFPDADLTIGPMTLFSGITYGIIIDGKQAAQCDFQMLLTTNATQNPPLPLSFETFRGQMAQGVARLEWSLPQVETLAYFEVERSLDGQLFAAVDQLVAEPQQYVFNWSEPLTSPATYYYRIVGIDQDGARTYSERLALHYMAAELQLIAASYNEQQLQLQYEQQSDQPLMVELLDLSGRSLYQAVFYSPQGTQNRILSPGDLPHGLYLLRLSNDRQRITQKLLVD